MNDLVADLADRYHSHLAHALRAHDQGDTTAAHYWIARAAALAGIVQRITGSAAWHRHRTRQRRAWDLTAVPPVGTVESTIM